MKRRWGGLLIALGVGVGLMAFRKQATPPDLSSPKATVRSFLSALKSRDTVAIQQCVKGATNQDFVKQIFGGPGAVPVASVSNLIEQTENSTAHVAVEFTMQVPASSHPDAKMVTVRMVDMFSLVKQGETWQLVPDPAFTDFAGNIANGTIEKLVEMRPLSFAVALAGSPEQAKILGGARAQAQAESCLSNTKQIALGVLMYTQDYDEILPRKGASYADLVYPYIKNRAVYTCPLDPKGTVSYTLNSGVTGIPLSAVTTPAKTVMLYEGKAGKLDYRHNGTAAVGFMDGHCKLIHPEEATALIWMVKVPPAAKPVKKKAH